MGARSLTLLPALQRRRLAARLPRLRPGHRRQPRCRTAGAQRNSTGRLATPVWPPRHPLHGLAARLDMSVAVSYWGSLPLCQVVVVVARNPARWASMLEQVVGLR